MFQQENSRWKQSGQRGERLPILNHTNALPAVYDKYLILWLGTPYEHDCGMNVKNDFNEYYSRGIRRQSYVYCNQLLCYTDYLNERIDSNKFSFSCSPTICSFKRRYRLRAIAWSPNTKKHVAWNHVWIHCYLRLFQKYVEQGTWRTNISRRHIFIVNNPAFQLHLRDRTAKMEILQWYYARTSPFPWYREDSIEDMWDPKYCRSCRPKIDLSVILDWVSRCALAHSTYLRRTVWERECYWDRCFSSWSILAVF